MRIAVIIPCFNEELTVARVVRDAKNYLPEADVFVFDNNSTDKTFERAKEAGAIVIRSPRQGKGNVIRHAFSVIDADIFLMTDGDDTYPMEHAHKLIKLVEDHGYDMVIGTRLQDYSSQAFRKFHLIGNRFLSKTVSVLFKQKVTDMLSGFRAFSRNFAEQVPINSRGFEIETDLTLQASDKGFAIAEVNIPYRARPAGSYSKLKTFDDGFLILKFIFRIIRDYRPLSFFSLLALACFILGLVCGWAPVMDYLRHAYVYTVPRAILAASLMLMACVLFGVGLILDAQKRHFSEQYRLMQLSIQKKTKRESALNSPIDYPTTNRRQVS